MTRQDKLALRKVAIASSIGTTIGWYDFFIYNLASVFVFDSQFFQGGSKALMKTLLLYGVGFVARPVGGLMCGHFGDRTSRKSMLVFTLWLTGCATFLIGLLPSYHKINIWAPAILIGLRFAQGLSVGGEWAGAVILPVEHSLGYRRGYYASWIQFGVPAGLFLSTVVFLGLVRNLPAQWGWRVPFLLSIVLVAVGVYIRRTINDSSVFIKSQTSCLAMPVRDLLKHHRKDVLLAMGAKIAENGAFYLYTTFVLVFASKEHPLYSQGEIFAAIALAALLMLPAIPLFGHLSDVFGRKPVYLAGALITGVFAFPFMRMVASGNAALMTIAVVVGLVFGWSAMYAPQASFFAELFKTRTRYTGASFGAQMSTIFAGGLAPFVALWLLNHFGNWAVAVYLISMVVITGFSVMLMPETAQRSIADEDSRENIARHDFRRNKKSKYQRAA